VGKKNLVERLGTLHTDVEDIEDFLEEDSHSFSTRIEAKVSELEDIVRDAREAQEEEALGEEEEEDEEEDDEDFDSEDASDSED